MDEETKQLLREIRDLHQEHLAIIRAASKEAADLNRVAMDNQTKWSQQNKQSTKWAVIIVVILVVGFIALEVVKRMK